MSHTVRMEFGDSKKTYGGDNWATPLNPPQQGLGQGNGAAPDIWDIVRTTLLNCPRKAGHGTAFKFYISGDTKNLVGYCFVDDSTIVQICPSPETSTQDTLRMSQEVHNIFAEVAIATVGQVIVY